MIKLKFQMCQAKNVAIDNKEVKSDNLVVTNKET